MPQSILHLFQKDIASFTDSIWLKLSYLLQSQYQPLHHYQEYQTLSINIYEVIDHPVLLVNPDRYFLYHLM